MAGFRPQRPGFEPWSGRVRFVVDKAVLGQVPPVTHSTRLHPGLVQWTQSHPTPRNETHQTDRSLQQPIECFPLNAPYTGHKPRELVGSYRYGPGSSQEARSRLHEMAALCTSRPTIQEPNLII
jgi:hypothetical protein